jgi:PIN domain nuclease of toxin-antitoxin system
MSDVLLDTHAFLWWLAGDRRFPPVRRRALSGGATVYVSAASAWEIATKLRLGRLPGARAIEGAMAAVVAREGFRELSITLSHAESAGGLPGPLQDPFDRILIAQSLIESLAIISADAAFDRYGVKRLWA